MLVLVLSTVAFVKAGDIADQGFVPVKGGQLYYTVSGQGEPLVILHGGPGMDHSYFLPQMEMLSKQYRIIFYDQRACGRSSVDVDSSSLSMDQFVEDLESLRKYFMIEKMNLLGHSFGGLLAMRYAIRYPDHLRSLILVNSTPASSAWRDSSFSLMAKRKNPETDQKTASLLKTAAFRDRDPDTMAYFFRLLFSNSFYDPAKVDELTLHFQQNYPESNRMMNYLHKDSTLMRYNLIPELRKSKVPALIIGSEADIIPPLAVEELHRSLQNSEYTFLEACGHFPFIEQPELFFKAINRFMGKLN